MRPLSWLSAGEARRVDGVLFDLDDTLLDHGALRPEAFDALGRLRRAGLRLVACTGRPASWAELLASQWPIDAAIAENGAVAFATYRAALAPEAGLEPPAAPAKLTLVSRPGAGARRAELLALAHELVTAFPEARLADDNAGRRTDVTLDVHEHRRVEQRDVLAMRARAEARGARTLHSSVHLHLTFEGDDKASGSLRALERIFGVGSTRARARYAYVGDSGNDADAFAAFALTFGVANVARHLGRLTVPPRYVTPSPMGRGFAEMAERLASLRLSRG
jgi:HAD superfamily hydrolase (TIGR01484 family)